MNPCVSISSQLEITFSRLLRVAIALSDFYSSFESTLHIYLAVLCSNRSACAVPLSLSVSAHMVMGRVVKNSAAMPPLKPVIIAEHITVSGGAIGKKLWETRGQ